MEMKTITINSRAVDWQHFVNGVCSDAGVAPTAEVLVSNWVAANTDYNNSMSPDDWTVPNAADAPSEAELLAAWHEARKTRAVAAIQRHMEEVGTRNAKAHAIASAEAQIGAAIEAEIAIARQYTTITVSEG